MLGYLFKGLRKIISQPYAVIVPPSGYGSIGDDAMVRVLIRSTEKQNLTPIILGGYDADTWAHIGDVKTADSRKKTITAVNLVMLLLKSRNLYIIGADIMDGHYDTSSVYKRLKLAKLFSKIGIDVRITGFSFNDHPNKTVCGMFNQIENTKLFLRDALSLERFESKAKREATLSADLAFLTKSSASCENVKNIMDWVDQKKNSGGIVIIININWLPFRSSNVTVDELIARYTEICLEVSSKIDNRVSFLMVPNDFRDPDHLGDRRLAQLLYNSLSTTLGDDSKLVDVDFNAEDLKLFSKKCDFVITGRMHLAIITATNGIPAFSVSYQSKFAGFYELIGMDSVELLIEPQDLFENDIADKILQNIYRRATLSSIINKKLSNIRDTVEKCLYQT